MVLEVFKTTGSTGLAAGTLEFYAMEIFAAYELGVRPPREMLVSEEQEVTYHGIANRPDAEKSWHRCTLRSGFRHPIHVIRSGTFVPELFSPEPAWLVVSQDLCDRLDGLGSFEFLPVIFDRLVDFQCELGDFTISAAADAGQGPSATNYLKALPDIPALHEQVGPYYEIIGAHYKLEVLPEFEGHPTTRIQDCLGALKGYGKFDVNLCPAMFERHGIILTSVILMTSEIHDILGPHFDPDYYNVREYTI